MITDFIRHLFPRVVLRGNLRITYTLCLGGLAFTMLLILAFTGILLLFYYQPTPSEAYRSILFLESSVSGGAYLRSLHRICSHLLLTLVFLHTLRVLLTGAYRHPREFTWLIGFLLLLGTLFEGYTGYVLPMDQLAWWATQTGMELVRLVPFGQAIREILIPDGVGQTLSLLRFYALHVVVLPGAIFILAGVHFYRIRKQKGLLPYL
jgi:quinol-cytochrome oxidoreductase complex cytochrome b subunit